MLPEIFIPCQHQNNTFTTFIARMPRPSMHVDIVKFRQCLLNLLSNACKFTENGKISLDVLADHGPEGRSTRWIVKDTGIGDWNERPEPVISRFLAS